MRILRTSIPLRILPLIVAAVLFVTLFAQARMGIALGSMGEGSLSNAICESGVDVSTPIAQDAPSRAMITDVEPQEAALIASMRSAGVSLVVPLFSVAAILTAGVRVPSLAPVLHPLQRSFVLFPSSNIRTLVLRL
jgi:hypothetical protein